MNTSAIYNKLHIVNRIGGGREGFAQSSHAVDVSGGSYAVGFSAFIICALALLLVGCRPKATVCGVPVSGTPWELAAAIHDHGDGSFVPVSVNEYSDKAYISGYFLPDETPAHIVCDVQDGEVVMAVVYQSTANE